MKITILALIAALPAAAAAADFDSLAVRAETLHAAPADLPQLPDVPIPHIPNPSWNGSFPAYHFGGYREACVTLDFTASSPLTREVKMAMEEYGEECRSVNGVQQFCSPVTFKHKRKVAVSVGPRELGPSDTETLRLCMSEPRKVMADTSGMLYSYRVEVRNEDYLLQKKTFVTLTPLGEKTDAARTASPAAQARVLTGRLQALNAAAEKMRGDMADMRREAERMLTFGAQNPYFAPALRRAAAAMRAHDLERLSPVLSDMRALAGAAVPDREVYGLSRPLALEAVRLYEAYESGMMRDAGEIENLVRRIPPAIAGHDAAWSASELARNASSARWVAKDIGYNADEIERRSKPAKRGAVEYKSAEGGACRYEADGGIFVLAEAAGGVGRKLRTIEPRSRLSPIERAQIGELIVTDLGVSGSVEDLIAGTDDGSLEQFELVLPGGERLVYYQAYAGDTSFGGFYGEDSAVRRGYNSDGSFCLY